MGQVPNGSSLQGASNDMQHDLPRSTFDLDLRSNFEVDLNVLPQAANNGLYSENLEIRHVTNDITLTTRLPEAFSYLFLTVITGMKPPTG